MYNNVREFLSVWRIRPQGHDVRRKPRGFGFGKWERFEKQATVNQLNKLDNGVSGCIAELSARLGVLEDHLDRRDGEKERRKKKTTKRRK